MYFYSIQIIHVNILGHQSQINAESICSSTQPQPNCFLTKPHYNVDYLCHSHSLNTAINVFMTLPKSTYYEVILNKVTYQRFIILLFMVK